MNNTLYSLFSMYLLRGCIANIKSKVKIPNALEGLKSKILEEGNESTTNFAKKCEDKPRLCV